MADLDVSPARLALAFGASVVAGLVVIAALAVGYQGGADSFLVILFWPGAVIGLLFFIEIVLAAWVLPRLPALTRIWTQTRVLAPLLVVAGAVLIGVGFMRINLSVDSTSGFQYVAPHPVWLVGVFIVWITITNWPLRRGSQRFSRNA